VRCSGLREWDGLVEKVYEMEIGKVLVIGHSRTVKRLEKNFLTDPKGFATFASIAQVAK